MMYTGIKSSLYSRKNAKIKWCITNVLLLYASINIFSERSKDDRISLIPGQNEVCALAEVAALSEMLHTKEVVRTCRCSKSHVDS